MTVRNCLHRFNTLIHRAVCNISIDMTSVLLVIATIFLTLPFCEGSGQCVPVFDADGDISIGLTLAQCAALMSDPYQPITHIKKYVDAGETLNVEVRFTINNLVSINELENTVTLDFYYRIFWQDVRWNQTDAFWAEMPPSVYGDGIELYALTFEAENPLPYWRPDLYFVDIKESAEYGALVKLLPEGQFYWSRHVVATFLQPDFNLKDYPNDEQILSIVFESYGLTQGVMGLAFRDPPIEYTTDDEGDVAFGKNPIWYHDQNDYETTVYENDYTNVESFPRIFVALEAKLRVQRAGRGILVRYALPILILLLLSAATFWADVDSRIDTTMTILLSVSALYVVIIQGIPQVGYLTTFDDWIFVMYTALAAFVVLHQIVIVLNRKTTRVPLRNCVIRSIEFMGRIFVGPLSFLYYMLTFMNKSPVTTALYAVVMVGFVVFIGTREWGGLKKSFVEAAHHIQDKIDEAEKITRTEMFVMNFVSYRKFSVSAVHYNARLSRKRRSEYAAKRDIEMRKKRDSDSRADSDDED